jgi:signal transduction histidine kinase
MDKTILEIPTELMQTAKITPEDLKRELAIRLYQTHKLNDKQAAELAGVAGAIESIAWSAGETGHFKLDDFLDWASHDLKTPLNAVIGFSKVVLKGIDGPINETQETDLTTVFNSGQRMLSLISMLVEVARINNGRTTLARESYDIASLISETANRWKSQNPSKPLTTDIQIASPMFDIDPIQIRQTINYLLALASIRVTEGVLSLSARDNEHGLEVSIQSTGKKNVDKMEMDSAMLRFITASLVKLHNGTIHEPHETDDGLQLSFSLPR